jgi:membrane protein implicated in regulation of membrane protease activity
MVGMAVLLPLPISYQLLFFVKYAEKFQLFIKKLIKKLKKKKD